MAGLERWDSGPEDTAGAARRMLKKTFSPTAPITQHEVFAGRKKQLERLDDAILQSGQHAVIYGDRGVGKTSLAIVAKTIAQAGGYFVSLVTCDSASTFASIWRQVFREINVLGEDGSVGGASYLLEGDSVSADDVRLAFKTLSFSAPIVVFVDEFDTVSSETDRRLFANLVKILSDQAVDVTIVLVGVAADVNTLVTDHASVQRVLAEVFMPRMSVEERIDIVRNGLEGAGMAATDDATKRIALLSLGMPAIVHRLGQHAGFEALERGTSTVEVVDVEAAVEPVVSQNMESISTVYDAAVFTTRSDTLFKKVALACACAPSDDKGFFTSGSLRVPLKEITGTRYEIPAYSAHLKAFSTTRGPLLEKVGKGRSFQYRFREPLYPAYITLRALRDGLISHEKLTKLSNQ
jgi:Cdc6-like AAA superfamily ATPase